MPTTHPAKSPHANNDRFSQYEQSWHHTIGHCYITWLKSEKSPIRRFLFSALFVSLGANCTAGYLGAPTLVYITNCLLTLSVVGVAVYLHHLEKG